MSSDSTRHSEDPAAAQQRFLSLFRRSEREIFRYVAALVPNVPDAEDIVQQTALVKEKALKINRRFRIGAVELGNWNASGFLDNDPMLIRNFSGAMDEFCLFSRALNDKEIRALFSAGKPQLDSVTELKTN